VHALAIHAIPPQPPTGARARRAAAARVTPAVRAVERAGVAHRVLAYAPDPGAPAFGRDAARALGLDPAHVFKTLVAATDAPGAALAVALVPADRQLDLKALADALGAKRAALADPAAAERATGYVVGGISPIGQRRRLVTVVDAAALALATVYVSAGRRGLELALAPADLVRLTGARVAAVAR
jgi:Cys-tRNA(Pro)/Cys-tRNA(Cys) deacylase